MKKLIAIFCIASAYTANAQNAFYNNGSIVQINGNAVVQINGDVVNNTNSSYINEGTVNIKGNFTNNQYMATPFNGVTRFEGSSVQTVNGSYALYAKNVEIAGRILLNDTLKIDGECKFINGIVKAASATNPVWFTSNGFVSTTNAASNASHVNGYVVKEGTGLFSYPVGDSNRYQKVDINLASNTNGMLVKYDTTNAGNGPYIPGGIEGAPLVAHNRLENWNCTPLGGAAGNVTMFWDDYRNGGIGNPSVLRVAHYKLGQWLNEGDVTTLIGSTTSGWVTSYLINSWSPFTLGSIDLTSTLPINWISVHALLAKNGQANIQWKVQENNVVTYEVQKSNDGINYHLIGTVISKGNGENMYAFTEAQTLNGKAFYRIKQADKDDQWSYSKTMLLNATDNYANVTVYPNPTANIVNINCSDKMLLNTKALLTDVNGKQLQTISIEQINTTINLAGYSNGMYLLKLQNGQVIKLVKE
jgi:Secretion system C-terminal sorting domain